MSTIKKLGNLYIQWIEARTAKVQAIIEADPEIQENLLVFQETVEAELEELKKAAMRFGAFFNDSIEVLAVGYLKGASAEIGRYCRERSRNSNSMHVVKDGDVN